MTYQKAMDRVDPDTISKMFNGKHESKMTEIENVPDLGKFMVTCNLKNKVAIVTTPEPECSAKKDLREFFLGIQSNKRYRTHKELNIEKEVNKFYNNLKAFPMLYWNIENQEEGYDKYFMCLKGDKLEIRRVR